MHSTAGIIADIDRVRRGQEAAFAQLGGEGSTLRQLRRMEDSARQFRELYQDLEQSLPSPGPSEWPDDYSIRLLQGLQRHSPDWRRVDLRKIAGHTGMEALKGIDRAIIGDALRVASDRTVGSFRNPGMLRAIHRTTPGGDNIVDYYGAPLSWMRQFQPRIVTQVEGFMKWL
jgi:hypothetical protein